MSSHAGKQTRSQQGAQMDAHAVQQSAGKRTLVEQAYAPVAPVQQRAGGDGSTAVHQAAAEGIATPSSALPYGDVIQKSFGRHDVSTVQAHAGRDAAATAGAMGADAYATGNHVVLGRGTDLFTVAHEAAHVVQQRGGVQCKGGVGEQGDSYERHADEVASLVVQGKSAESLLDPFAGGSGATTVAATATQFKLSIGGADAKSGTVESDVEAVWARISGDARLADILAPAKQLLTEWVTKDAKYADPSMVSQNRHYPSDELLIRALLGDVGAAANLEHEGALATRTVSEGQVNATLGGFIAKLQEFQKSHSKLETPANEKSGRYAGWAYGETGSSLASSLENVPADLKGRIAFIADYSLMMRRDIGTGSNFQMTAKLTEGRHTHHNTNEDSEWVKEAREAKAPVSAGPSATTAQVLALAVSVGATTEEKEALAWALFALWNIMPLHQSGTHRFHEVMAVAVQYGVSYEAFQYGDPPNKT